MLMYTKTIYVYLHTYVNIKNIYVYIYMHICKCTYKNIHLYHTY